MVIIKQDILFLMNGCHFSFLACIDQSEKDRWLSKLENSNWLLHVKEALTTACIVAQTIDCEGLKSIYSLFFF